MYPFRRTLRSLTRSDLLGIMLACAVLGILVAISSVAGITWLAANLIDIDTAWINTLTKWIIGTVTGIGGWFMLPVLIVFISGMFQENIIHRVEKEYYPDEIRSLSTRIWPDLRHDMAFTLWALFLNVMVLPFYLFGIGFMISILLNSYLLGREFFECAAGYHTGKPEARNLGRKNRFPVYGGGLIITLITLIPVVNLFVPVFAIVWMVHVFHEIQAKNRTTT